MRLQTERTERLPGIDALRGVAALSIVAWHQVGLTVAHPLFAQAYKSVGLFFMMSGFVMGAAYDRRLADGLHPWTFAVFRVRRLYPLYLTGALLGFVLAYVGLGLPGIDRAAAIHALPSAVWFWPGGLTNKQQLFPLDVPAWSLYFELLASFAYAFFFPALSERVLGAIFLVAFGLVEWRVLQGEGLDAGWYRSSFVVGLLRVSTAFPLGLLLYRLWLRGALQVPKAPIWVPSALFSLVIALPDTLLPRPISVVLTTLAFSWIVLLAASARSSPWGVRAASWLGGPSFAIYALHFPVFVAFHHLTAGPGSPQSVAIGATSVCLVLLLAVAATKWIDTPIRLRLGASLVSRPVRRSSREQQTPADLPSSDPRGEHHQRSGTRLVFSGSSAAARKRWPRAARRRQGFQAS